MRAAPPSDETVRLSIPALLFQEGRDGLGKPLLHIDDGTVLVERQHLDFAPQNVRRFHHVSLRSGEGSHRRISNWQGVSQWVNRCRCGPRASAAHVRCSPKATVSHQNASVVKGPGCVERGRYEGIVSAMPVSRSWSTNLKRTGSLTAQTHPGASARIDLNARYPSA